MPWGPSTPTTFPRSLFAKLGLVKNSTQPTSYLPVVRDEPVVVHCYTTSVDIEDARNLAALGEFCRRLGRETRQGEVGLVVGDEYFAIRDFREGAST